MEQAVILSQREQEYLLRAIESGIAVRDIHQFFLWTQGQFQALLPHQAMVCLQFGADGALRRLECLQGTVLAPRTLAALQNRVDGLALRLARHCREARRLPAMLDVGAREGGELDAFRDALRDLGFDNVLVHGSGALPNGASVFVLFGMPMRPVARHAYFFDLLLAHLHLALLRLPGTAAMPGGRAVEAAARPLSVREMEIVRWLAEGKSNDEVGCILGISGATVKNHLQRIYRVLGVSNRAHALARCTALRLLGDGAGR